MLIYIAAPYYDPNSSVTLKRMERIYGMMHHYIVNDKHPITPLSMHEIVARYDLNGTYEFWDRYCLNILKRCDEMHVLCLEGWDKSRGVAAEIQFCKDNNIPIRYISYYQITEITD